MDEQQAIELACSARDGNRAGFRALVEAFSRPLIAMAYRYTWDWEAARDLCQDTWVRVHEKLASFDPGRSFSGWLFTIHRNFCLSYLRRPARRREEPMDGADGRPRDWPGGGPGPEELFERRELVRRVRAALPELSDRQREVFALVDLEQMDQREAARVLGMTHVTLRTTLHTARRRLADLLRPSEVET
jgi:RNA polymerase sigma-70 factor (ECF subfamily)